MSYQIDLDATQLASPTVAISELAGSLDTETIQVVTFEPEDYVIQTHSTSDTDWVVEVMAQVVTEYALALDVAQGGFLGGRGKSTLELSGYTIELDALQNRRHIPQRRSTSRSTYSGGLL